MKMNKLLLKLLRMDAGQLEAFMRAAGGSPGGLLLCKLLDQLWIWRGSSIETRIPAK